MSVQIPKQRKKFMLFVECETLIIYQRDSARHCCKGHMSASHGKSLNSALGRNQTLNIQPQKVARVNTLVTLTNVQTSIAIGSMRTHSRTRGM
jgi:hypothetical protein